MKKAINDLERVTDRMLMQPLKELEEDGWIERTTYPVVPPKVNTS